jgi:hypothetical protein
VEHFREQMRAFEPGSPEWLKLSKALNANEIAAIQKKKREEEARLGPEGRLSGLLT